MSSVQNAENARLEVFLFNVICLSIVLAPRPIAVIEAMCEDEWSEKPIGLLYFLRDLIAFKFNDLFEHG